MSDPSTLLYWYSSHSDSSRTSVLRRTKLGNLENWRKQRTSYRVKLQTNVTKVLIAMPVLTVHSFEHVGGIWTELWMTLERSW